MVETFLGSEDLYKQMFIIVGGQNIGFWNMVA